MPELVGNLSWGGPDWRTLFLTATHSLYAVDTQALRIFPDLDTALETCGVHIVLVDHDVFRVVPLEERAGAVVYDTRGIWPDAGMVPNGQRLRLAS